jgi:hypothetical protein
MAYSNWTFGRPQSPKIADWKRHHVETAWNSDMPAGDNGETTFRYWIRVIL